MLKRIAEHALIILLLTIAAHAQGMAKAETGLNKSYWLNYSLIFLKGCQPKILPDNIVFTEGSCSFDAYAGKILLRGTKIELNSVNRDIGFARLSFKHHANSYEILLKNDSGKSFRRSFDLLFSDKEASDKDPCESGVRTKKQVIKCLGFPIHASKDRDVEQYFYILEFIGPSNPFSGYDGFIVKIKKGKVIGVSGYI